jgi:cyanophycin synthetase
MEALIVETQTRAFGPSTAALVRAAEARDIPWIRIGEASLVQFGHGFRQKRIWATVTSETRNIAVEIASDKALTNQILADMGLPVPKQVHGSVRGSSSNRSTATTGAACRSTSRPRTRSRPRSPWPARCRAPW